MLIIAGRTLERCVLILHVAAQQLRGVAQQLRYVLCVVFGPLTSLASFIAKSWR